MALSPGEKEKKEGKRKKGKDGEAQVAIKSGAEGARP
jgi:hypothetical protein